MAELRYVRRLVMGVAKRAKLLMASYPPIVVGQHFPDMKW